MRIGHAGAARQRHVSALVGVGLIGALLVALVLMQRITGAKDASRALQLPGWLEAIVTHDAIAYPAHAMLGTVLGWSRRTPIDTARQWVKAASHARSQEEVDRAAGGIAAAHERAGEDPAFRLEICQGAARGSPNVRGAIALAKLACDPDLFNMAHTPEATEIMVSKLASVSGTALSAVVSILSSGDPTGCPWSLGPLSRASRGGPCVPVSG